MVHKGSFRFRWVFILFLLGAAACQGKSSLPPTPTPSGPSGNLGTAPVDLPTKRLDEGTDFNSVSFANSKSITGGDNFAQGLYERPFNANTMDKYFPYIDIVDTQGFKDDTWGYATITLANTDANGHLPAQYAVELDLNKDGRGDWLVRVSSPASTSWSTQGVQAWKDSDGDIGGDIAMVADNKPQGGDGYETLVFDQGKGSLTDGAWARIKPDDPKTVEIAFKLSMLGSPSSYAMGAWAGTNIDPSMFDYNDHMTHIQAGSPNKGDGVYPIKAMAEIDNTCRLAIGFVPTTNVPGLCAVPAPKVQGGQPACNPNFYGIAGVPPCLPNP